MDKVVSFRPVFFENARILILGSAPSVKSLETGFYYGHPQNAFWKILSETFEEELPDTVEQKIELLRINRIALWDTIGECTRPGSLDSSIRDIHPNAYEECETACPEIRRILLNGKTAARLFLKNRGGAFPNAEVLTMPSTSPAFTLPYKEKRTLWESALKNF